jgi:hypothetical protein
LGGAKACDAAALSEASTCFGKLPAPTTKEKVCPYFEAAANCYSADCCTDQVKAAWQASADQMKTALGAECTIKCAAASGASGTSTPLAALAATLLALVATGR